MSSTYYKPNRALDFILLGSTIALLIPFIVANGVVYRNRKRKYFQASGWELILGCSVAGIICIGSSFIENKHFRLNHFKLFSNCAFWNFWVRLILGICLWLCCMALRLHHLHIFCTTGKRLGSLRICGLYLPTMLTPAIIYGTIATVLRVSRHACGPEGMCLIEDTNWKFTSYLFLPLLYFSMVGVFLYQLRKEKDYLLRTQWHHAKDYITMAFILYLYSGSTYWSGALNSVYARNLLTFFVVSVVFIHFLVHTGWPVYLCLFKQADEMDQFEESLRRQGASCLQTNPDLPHVDDSDGNVSPWKFSLDGEEPIFHAIAAEQSKKEELKMKKDQLQHLLTELRAQIDELKHQKILPFPPERLPHSLSVKGSEKVTRHLSMHLSAKVQAVDVTDVV